MINFELAAARRNDVGKGASRRLRCIDQVPAVLYGAGQDPVSLSFEHNLLLRSLAQEAFYSHILTINYDGVTEKAVLKAVQRHPAKPRILHLDLQRINENEKIKMHVPLHYINADKCVGVKAGGIVSHHLIDVEILCLPKDLPEYIEVDIAHLNIGQALHLSDLQMPAGVELVALTHGHSSEHNASVASIHVPRGAEETETPATPAATAATPTPPAS